MTALKSERTLLQWIGKIWKRFSFGDNSDLANRLLVLSGTKRATCWAESQGLLSAEIGLKTVELTKRRFDEVDEAFAYDKGEGDRSLRLLARGAYAILFAAWKILAGHDALV